MKIVDPDVMIQLHEEVTRCELCDNRHPKLEVHHIWSRGMGGGSRLDIPWNLIVLCQPCHMDAQANKIPKRTLWGIAAEREIFKLRRS